MVRTRDYYRAQDYGSDYQWAHHSDVPFASLTKPVSESRVVVITTSMPDDEVSKKMRCVVSTPCVPAPRAMFTDDLSWDKEFTHTNDVPSFLPIEQLQQLEKEGVIGALATRFHSVPTEYSKRNTVENDAPELMARCQQDEVDLAVLVPL